jgi:hypothetical protein
VCRCGELGQSNQLAIQVVLDHLAILEQHRLALKKAIKLRAAKLICSHRFVSGVDYGEFRRMARHLLLSIMAR